jgi:iron complex outermembrane receptor protein
MTFALALLFLPIDTLPPAADTQRIVLPAVSISGAVPRQGAATSLLTASDLQRFAGASLAEPLNTAPGVRMEERSPGSYRFSVRGSLLRSPFGVRNVKVYLDGIPLSDAGGGTYLQLVDVQTLGRVEVLNGPAGSIFGAGTGGAVLLETARAVDPIQHWETRAGLTAGAFGRLQAFAAASSGARRVAGLQHNASISHTQSDGYRAQTQLRRDAVLWQGERRWGRAQSLAALVWYSDLFYGTPGGLTLAEQEADPRQARPATAIQPGAVEQQAAVRNRTGQAALNYKAGLGAGWHLETIVFGRSTGFENPAIRNVEQRREVNGGGRIAFQLAHGTWRKTFSQLTFGVEATAGRAFIDTYVNDRGRRGERQTGDKLGLDQGFAFVQEKLTLCERWVVIAGASVNTAGYRFERRTPAPEYAARRLKPVASPRVSMQRVLGRYGQAYAVVSHGFSPPTIEELRPSTGAFNRTLAPEAGWNFELGGTLHTADRRLELGVAAFRFDLQQAIVLRRAPDGAEYFENAGGTRQRGLESSLQGRVAPDLQIRLAHTWYDFRFADYRRADEDFSGNDLTGVPPHVLVATADYRPTRGFFTNLTATYTERLPLDDANTVYAGAYTVLAARAGWRWARFEAFAGGDNLLNARYSAGHDLNAFGGRYYNPAAGRGWYVGVKLN